MPQRTEYGAAAVATPEASIAITTIARVVVVLVRDADARIRMGQAASGFAVLRFVETIADVQRALVDTPMSALLIEPRDSLGEASCELVRHVRRGYPRLPVLVYYDRRRATPSDLVAVIQAGAQELLFQEHDDIRVVLAATLESAAQQCMAEEVLRELGDNMHAAVRELLDYCLRNSSSPLTVERVARALGVHRKTLVVRCASAGAPPPGTLITWCRLLAAALALEEPGRSVEQVAHSLEFPSGTALRNLFKRYTGMTPMEVRGCAGGRRIAWLLKRELVRA